MMGSRSAGIAFGALVLFAAVGGCAARSGGVDEKLTQRDRAGSSASVQAADAVALGWEVAERARQRSSPLMLLAAARILLEHPAAALAPGDNPAEAEAPEQVDPQIVELIETASKLAAGDEALGALATTLRQRAERGVVRGARGLPRQRKAIIAPVARDVYRVTFLGDEPALVYVSGDGDTYLSLSVYDEEGRLVTAATGANEAARAEWLPEQTEKFRIEVRNLGRVSNAYRIVTN